MYMDCQAKEKQDNMSFPATFGALINNRAVKCTVKYTERCIVRLQFQWKCSDRQIKRTGKTELFPNETLKL